MWKMWLIISGFCLILEIFTVGFLVFWFAIGALIALLSSFLTDNVIIQSSVFVLSSTLLLFATRPFVNKFAKPESTIKTNASSIEGQIGIVISDIDPINGIGQIKVNGELWSAKSSDNSNIAKDTKVIIEKIDGVKAIVKIL